MARFAQVVTHPEFSERRRPAPRRTALAVSFSALLLSFAVSYGAEEPNCAMGPLRLDSSAPRYFVNPCGRAVYLTGSHTHLSMKDGGNRPAAVSPFDYEAYLDLMHANGHNFMRMWSGWELTMFEPLPWKRTGPGMARDGKPKFDLTQFDESYFERLRARVEAARERNIYVSVMLFEEWLLRFVEGSASQHPFDGANNVNGLDADRNGDGLMLEAHRLSDPAVTERQEAYLRKIVDTLNDLDNVLYEVVNEPVFPDSVRWQYHVIAFVKKYQASKANQHPVGITSAGFSSPYDDLDELLESDADWISPGRPLSLAYDYLENPPTVEIPKVIIADSDHLSKDLTDPAWVWKSLTRGVNPIFMDASSPLDSLNSADVTAMRKNMGYARMYADRMDLAASRPSP